MDDARDRQERARKQPHWAGDAPLVVIAEDDDDIRDALVCGISLDHVRVHAVSDGEALAEFLQECHARKDPPAVIVTDHRMPGYSGLEVLEGLEEMGWPIPVILLTAFGPEVRPLAKAHGALAVFDKPCDLDDLRTSIMWAVEWAERRKKARSRARHPGPLPADLAGDDGEGDAEDYPEAGPSQRELDMLVRLAKVTGLAILTMHFAANLAQTMS